MASSEKELEGQLMEAGNRLASPPSSVEELLSLLDQTESFLSRVEQSPSQSMLTALNPARNALVAKELLSHSDLDVKVAAASCISEITRITAPEAPYEDDLMREAFQLIVQSFEKLDDRTSRSHAKRVSILETVAKVRSCVVMLDLECDALILEMFHHFLKTISPDHSENIFSSMETIMRLVLEESEDVPTDLLSRLLHSVRKDNKDVPPIACRLAEKVISNSAVKLRPYLVEFVQSTSSPLSEYGDVVFSICQRSADELEQNDINASSECLADDSKLSERTVSDELPQGSVILEPEIVCPEEVGTAADKSPRSVMSNGTAEMGNADSAVEPIYSHMKPEHSHHSDHSNDKVASVRAESENLDSIPVKSDGMLDKNAKKGRFRKTNLAQIRDTNVRSQVGSDKEVHAMSSWKEGQAKGASADGPSGREAESEFVDSENKDDFLPPAADNGTLSGALPTNNEGLSDTTRPRRGRPLGGKLGAKRGSARTAADLSASSSGRKGASENDQSANESLPSRDPDSKKDIGFRDSEGKALRHLSKRLSGDNSDDGETLVTKDSSNMEVDRGSGSGATTPLLAGKKGSRGKLSERRSLDKLQNSKTKIPKGKTSLEEEAVGELTLKEMASTPRSIMKASSKDHSHLEESGKTKSRRKRTLGTKEISETLDHKKELGEKLIGSKIKVWWPDDKQFYDGVVESFDPASRKHKVVYVDGDIEILLLNDERWEFIEDGGLAVSRKRKGSQMSDAAEMHRNKKAGSGSDSTPKQLKRGRPRKSEGLSEGKSRLMRTEPGGKTGSDLMKSKGRRKGSASADIPTTGISKGKAISKLKEGIPKASSKFGDPGKSKGDSPTPGSKSKDDKRSGRFKDDTHTTKTISKLKDDAIDSGGELKNNAAAIDNESNEDVPIAGRKCRGIASPEGVKNVKANGTSEGKSKVREHESSASEKTQDSEAVAANKRRRKGGG